MALRAQSHPCAGDDKLATPDESTEGIWHGGMVSGHSAVGFFLAMTILFSSRNTFVAILALLMALIIAQSRVEVSSNDIGGTGRVLCEAENLRIGECAENDWRMAG